MYGVSVGIVPTAELWSYVTVGRVWTPVQANARHSTPCWTLYFRVTRKIPSTWAHFFLMLLLTRHSGSLHFLFFLSDTSAGLCQYRRNGPCTTMGDPPDIRNGKQYQNAGISVKELVVYEEFS